MKSFYKFLLAFGGLFLLNFSLSAQCDFGKTPVSDDVIVNTEKVQSQLTPNIAKDAMGNFIIVYNSNVENGSTFDIYGQRFDKNGNKVGDEFRINETDEESTVDEQGGVVAMNDIGDFVVAWRSSALGVRARRFNTDGVPQGSEIAVHNVATFPDIAMDNTGNFVVTFIGGDNPNAPDVLAQRYNADGTPNGNQIIVTEQMEVARRSTPVVDTDANGNFTVAWVDGEVNIDGADGSDGGIFMRQYSALGVANSGVVLVNNLTENHQYQPSIAMNNTGEYAITWASRVTQSDFDVFVRSFMNDGTPRQTQARVNTFTPSPKSNPKLAINANGCLAISWTGGGNQDSSGDGIITRTFSQNLTPTSDELIVNTATVSSQSNPAISLNDNGNCTITWSGLLIGVSGSVGFDVAMRMLQNETTSLPLAWLNFQVTPHQKQVELQWQTAHTTNLNHFEIERSRDGIYFEFLQSVLPTNKSRYVYFDNTPQKARNYYRIKQIDSDGQFSYSPIQSVAFLSTEIDIFPNPVTHILTIKWQEDDFSTLKIVDNLGKTVFQKNINTPFETTLNLAQLPQGIYHLSLQSDHQQITRKIHKR